MNNDPVNDLVMGGIDQFLPIKQAQKDILKRVDDVMAEAVEAGNPEVAFKAMEGLLGVSQISGIALSKFLYTMKYQWPNFNQRDSFFTVAEERFGRKEVTLKRNLRVWEMLVSDDIPKDYAEKFKTMPIRCLIPIANMWDQDWDVTSNQWMRLANAPDPATISKIIREIKGTEPKEGSMQIEFDTESKTLCVWKNNKPHNIYLTYDEDDEVIQAGLARLFSDKVLER